MQESRLEYGGFVNGSAIAGLGARRDSALTKPSERARALPSTLRIPSSMAALLCPLHTDVASC
eukprot:6023439-Pleurochrysis_carterae.AAC.1